MQRGTHLVDVNPFILFKKILSVCRRGDLHHPCSAAQAGSISLEGMIRSSSIARLSKFVKSQIFLSTLTLVYIRLGEDEGDWRSRHSGLWKVSGLGFTCRRCDSS